MQCDGHYSRWSIKCQACEDKCAPGLIGCYGAHEPGNLFCEQCPYAEYCRGAKEPPSRALDVISAEQSPPPISEHTMRAAILRHLWESCNRDPLQVAIVIARAEGMNIRQIARALGISCRRVWAVSSPRLGTTPDRSKDNLTLTKSK